MAVENENGSGNAGGDNKDGDGGDKGTAGAGDGKDNKGGSNDGKGSGSGDGDGKGSGDGKGDGDGKDTSLLGGAGKDGKDGDGKGGDKREGAPEEYADFTMPEGVEKNEETMKSFGVLAKELDLSQAHAQKLVDFQAASVKAQADANLAEFKKTTDGWRSETEKALGANFKEELGFAGKALDRFGTAELRALLDDTKVGDHPELAKFMVKVGKATSEDKLLDGKPGGKGKISDGKLFYPNMAEQMKS